jgi:hypothetical protein
MKGEKMSENSDNNDLRELTRKGDRLTNRMFWGWLFGGIAFVCYLFSDNGKNVLLFNIGVTFVWIAFGWIIVTAVIAFWKLKIINFDFLRKR